MTGSCHNWLHSRQAGKSLSLLAFSDQMTCQTGLCQNCQRFQERAGSTISTLTSMYLYRLRGSLEDTWRGGLSLGGSMATPSKEFRMLPERDVAVPSRLPKGWPNTPKDPFRRPTGRPESPCCRTSLHHSDTRCCLIGGLQCVHSHASAWLVFCDAHSTAVSSAQVLLMFRCSIACTGSCGCHTLHLLHF